MTRVQPAGMLVCTIEFGILKTGDSKYPADRIHGRLYQTMTALMKPISARLRIVTPL